MFNFICKPFLHLSHSLTTSPTHTLHYLLQLNHLLSFSSKPRSNNEKDHSFTVNYLIKRCGFAPESAISASKYVNFNNPDKPDAVLSFLKNQGFSDIQVLKIIKTYPRVVLCNPKKAILPKIEFFQLKGFPNACLPSIFVNTPTLFKSTLENQIVPAYNFICDMLGSTELTIMTIKRHPHVLLYLRSYLVPNIEILQEAGVPKSSIVFLMKCNPRTFMRSAYRFKELVDEVKQMGINPLRLNFISGVWVRSSLTRSSWIKKMEVYKRWGCSEENVKEAFTKHPWCMSTSEDKITSIMNVLVNEMGCDPLTVMKRPRVISSSFKKVIIPRCSVYQVLLSKGLIKKTPCLSVMFASSEKVFLKKFVECYEGETSMLLKLYHEKMEQS